MQAYCKDLQVLDINGQFGKLTDRKEIPVPELAEGGPRSFVRNELRMLIRWCSPRAFSFFFSLFLPNSQPSSLREKGPSLR